jgi:hypothetical protein
LDAVHAAEAYALGPTGAGVVIGVVDYNFDLSQSDLRFDPASLTFVSAWRALAEAESGPPTSSPHGGSVAAVAAATKNNSGIHGIAFGETILAVDYFSGVNERQQLFEGTNFHISNPWSYLADHGVRIVNQSASYDEEDLEDDTAADIAIAPVAPHAKVSEAYRVERRYLAIARGMLFVNSAGNDGDPDPALSNLDTLDDMRARNLMNGPGAFIIAGAVDSNLKSVYDRAGIARDFYMVAPAFRVVGPSGSGPSLFFLSGTSFAAPMVSGAAALVMERWPTLTAKQVADILFASATDLGAPGVDEIYGHGLLNVAAALQPLGGSTLMVANGAPAPIAQTTLTLGPAFGDGGGLSHALRSTSMRDGFGRDFAVDLSGAVAIRGAASLQTLLTNSANWHAASFTIGSATQLQFQMHDDPQQHAFALQGVQADPQPRTVVRLMGEADGFSWSAGNAMSLAAALSPANSIGGMQSLTGGSGAILDMAATYASATMSTSSTTALAFGFAELDSADPLYASTGHMAGVSLLHREQGSSLSFQLLGLAEEGSLLGSAFGGGLRLGDHAATAAATAGVDFAVAPHWRLFGNAGFATTKPGNATASIVAGLSPILSASYRIGLARADVFGMGDAVYFSLTQPQRVEQATATLALEGMRDTVTGAVPFTTRNASLVPSGREVALESAYATFMGAWSMQMNVAYRIDAGHIDGRDDLRAALMLNRAF